MCGVEVVGIIEIPFHHKKPVAVLACLSIAWNANSYGWNIQRARQTQQVHTKSPQTPLLCVIEASKTQRSELYYRVQYINQPKSSSIIQTSERKKESIQYKNIIYQCSTPSKTVTPFFLSYLSCALRSFRPSYASRLSFLRYAVSPEKSSFPSRRVLRRCWQAL